MSRARNIKPSFFMNEELGELPFEARLFFIGLWCLCDPQGKMEFRPKRVKAELFPYDDVDCTRLAQCLHSAGLIKVYEVAGEAYIWVPTFTKHQTPHMKEKPRGLPDYSEAYDAAPDEPSASPVPAQLNPEPGILNPDVLNADGAAVAAPKNNPTKASPRAKPLTTLDEYLGGSEVQPADWQQASPGEWERFCNHHIGKGNKWRDWKRSWDNWCGSRFVNGGTAQQRHTDSRPVSKLAAVSSAVMASTLARQGLGSQAAGAGTGAAGPNAGRDGHDLSPVEAYEPEWVRG